MPSVTITFTQQSDDETSFEVQRKEAGGTFAFLTPIAADVTPSPSTVTIQDFSVLAGITYTYRVRALNGALSSAWSNEASVTMAGDPPPPVIVPDPSDLGGYRPQMPRAYGMDTVGGRGAGTTPVIIRVNTLTYNTTLTPVGDGTFQGGLKRALEYAGPRYILLEDSGTIDFGSDYIQIANPYLTVAGQCAPGQGVNIVGGGSGQLVEVNTHDVVLQHFRVRAGGGGPCYSALGIYNGPAATYNVVFDHLSCAWGQDENLYAYGHDLAFWRCLSAEALYQTPSASACGENANSQGHGILFAASAQRVAVIGCLLVSCGRGPEVHDDSSFFVGDTLNYNGCGPVSTHNPAASLWYQPSVHASVGTYINFRAKPGPDTPNGYAAIRVYYDVSGNQVYLNDCTVSGSYVPFVFTGTDPRVGASPVTIPPGWLSIGSSALESWVAAHAGAFPLNRDAVDTRLLSEVAGGTGSWKITRPSSPSISHAHATFSVPANPFGDIDVFGRNNLDRALEVAALAVE